MPPHKVAALYDIHGNLPALDAVLDAITMAQVDAIVVGGDIVTGPMPRETIERLRAVKQPLYVIRGNTDRLVVDAFDGKSLEGLDPDFRDITLWTARQLDRSQRDFLAGQPEAVSLGIDSLGPVLFCHAVPGNDEVLITRMTPDERLHPLLDGAEQSIIVAGHTHMQFDRQVGSKRLINAGSVGMPYGEPGAYWATFGPEVDLIRTTYDLERAASLIEATSYPQAEDFAQNNVLRPAAESEAIDVFERRAAEREKSKR